MYTDNFFLKKPNNTPRTEEREKQVAFWISYGSKQLLERIKLQRQKICLGEWTWRSTEEHWKTVFKIYITDAAAFLPKRYMLAVLGRCKVPSRLVPIAQTKSNTWSRRRIIKKREIQFPFGSSNGSQHKSTKTMKNSQQPEIWGLVFKWASHEARTFWWDNFLVP